MSKVTVPSVTQIPDRAVPEARLVLADGGLAERAVSALVLGGGVLLGGCAVSVHERSGFALAQRCWALSVPDQPNPWRDGTGDWRVVPHGVDADAVEATVRALVGSASATIQGLLHRHEGALDAVVRLAREG